MKIFCWLFHRKHRCYPEVWKVERGNWHCEKCHPCTEGFVELGLMTQDVYDEGIAWEKELAKRENS